MPEIITITHADYAGEYKIKATFSNGIEKVIDFAPLISDGRGLLAKLKDQNYFRQFSLDPFTIEWAGEIGFDPEYLLSFGSKEKEEDYLLGRCIVAEETGEYVTREEVMKSLGL